MLLRAALATFEGVGDDYEVAMTLGNLAALHQQRGDLEAAAEMHRRSLGTKERVLGSEHPELASVARARPSEPGGAARQSDRRA